MIFAQEQLYWLPVNEAVTVGNIHYYFREITVKDDNINSVFDIWLEDELQSTEILGKGDSFGEFSIVDIFPLNAAVLQVVFDPGYILVLVALVIIVLGLFLTYFQKLGDRQV